MSSCNHNIALLVILTLVSPVLVISNIHDPRCIRDFQILVSKRNITNCKKLHTLGAEFGWKQYPNGSTIDICLGAPQKSDNGWLGWGVNPLDRPQMVGTRAIVGIRLSNGSLAMNTYNLTSGTKLGCGLKPSAIDVEVKDMRVEYLSNVNFMVVCARLVLPTSMYNTERLNHVWQVGYDADGVEPLKHRTTLQNVDSTETLNMTSRSSESAGVLRVHIRTVHGIFNIVGWGTFLPVGVIIARYYRAFPFHTYWWRDCHIVCQFLGYLIGTIGWIIGLYLGKTSTEYTFPIHGLISNFLFTFATVQMLAIRLRPSSSEEFVKYWRMYHHFLGYALLALIVVNIFRGIGIFTPNHSWKVAYIGVLGILTSVTLGFEIYTWYKFKLEKSKTVTTSPPKDQEKSTPERKDTVQSDEKMSTVSG